MQTVDFFTPVVDDPYDFGRIAAANALSDVYAMGGVPITALNIVGFPVGTLPLSVLHEILRGGADKAIEAEVAIIGGHSIDDMEPKFGMAVTGRVHPDRILTNAGGTAGDILVLTKPLGVGILTTAIKRGRLDEAETRAVVELMAALNRAAGEVAAEHGLRAATDVTGYGLLGHAHEMGLASGLSVEIEAGKVPLLTPRVLDLAAEGVVPGGSRKNLRFMEERADWDSAVGPALLQALADAQTSGGLLLAVPPAKLDGLLASLVRRGTPSAAPIGRLVAGVAGRVRIAP